MAGSNINRVIITGNLTKDPDLGAVPGSGTPVCSLRIACNGRRRTGDGNWEDAPNYFDVSVFGGQAENCYRYLSKGRPVAVDGRLRWREWERDGQKRQAVDIVAESVQFLGAPREDAGNGNGNGYSSSVRSSESDVPIDTGDFERTPVAAGADDDIPF